MKKETMTTEQSNQGSITNKRRVFERNWDDINKSKLAIIGSSVSIASMVAFYPFALAKTRMQSSASNQAAVGLFSLLRQIRIREGYRGLFRGFTTATIGHCLGEWVYYPIYEITRHQYDKYFNHSDGIANFAMKEISSGVVSQVACDAVIVPFDIVAQRLMIQEMNTLRYKGGLDAVKQIYRMEGIRGLFQGFGASILTHAPESALWWVIYGYVKKELYLIQPESWQESSFNNGSFTIHLMAGSVAGGLTSILMNPFDIIKTRLQVQGIGDQGYRYKNFIHALWTISTKEGLATFTAGMKAKILYMAPVSGLHIAMYEFVKRMSTD